MHASTLRWENHVGKKQKANQGGSLCNNILSTACNSIKDHYLIHVSKIHTHLSTTTLARVFFRTDFQLPEWFLLKKFLFKSPYVNCCPTAVLWLLNEFCFILKKNWFWIFVTVYKRNYILIPPSLFTDILICFTWII